MRADEAGARVPRDDSLRLMGRRWALDGSRDHGRICARRKASGVDGVCQGQIVRSLLIRIVDPDGVFADEVRAGVLDFEVVN